MCYSFTHQRNNYKSQKAVTLRVVYYNNKKQPFRIFYIHVYWLLLQCQNTTRLHAYCYKQVFRLAVLQNIIDREKRSFRME